MFISFTENKNNMRDNAQRISHSIDAIEDIKQVVPHFQWINLFENMFSDEAGVNQIAQLLRNQLSNIEL